MSGNNESKSKKTDNNSCLFCNCQNNTRCKIVAENSKFYARWDDFPVSPGHAEVVPKKHIKSLFGLSESDLAAMWEMINQTKKVIDSKYKPDGYNIGVNDGQVAGQSIMHLHIHLIPRYKGDVENPRGGIRHAIPGKGNY